MNGRGLWLAIGVLATFIGASFAFTLTMSFKTDDNLKDAILDRNARIKDLREMQDSRWISLGNALDHMNENVLSLRDRVRALECTQGSPNCAPVAQPQYK